MTYAHFSLQLKIVRKIVPPLLDSWVKPSVIDCADTRIIRTPSRHELLYTRSKIVAAARTFGLDAIDMVSCYSNFRACDGLSPVRLGLC